jgi:hypothetical protein
MSETDFMDKVNIESTIRTDSSKYNEGTKNAQLIHEILNSGANWTNIVNKIKAGKARDISDEPKVLSNTACFILGSGPSLDDSIQYLKDWEGGIICTTSHAMTLMYYGIEPSHILILDPFCQWSELAGVDWSKTKTKLIMHPGCYPDLIENWPNDILLYLQNAGRLDSFYQNEQQKMYSWRTGDYRLSTFNFYIRTGITIFACSPPMQLFVGEVLGYDKFYLAGCDFAYHTDKDRFTDYTININHEDHGEQGDILSWEKHEHLMKPDNPNLFKTNSGLLSEPIHIYYLKNMISAWRLCGKTMYTTDHGAMIQVPYKDIKDVIKRKGDYPYQTKFFINDVCDKYLTKTGAFVIETSKGVSFVESNNFELELPTFMKNVMARYQCDACHSSLTANQFIYRLPINGEIKEFDNPNNLLFEMIRLKQENKLLVLEPEIIDVSDINHENEECPVCHKGKLVREVFIDINKNMSHIREYLKKE